MRGKGCVFADANSELMMGRMRSCTLNIYHRLYGDLLLIINEEKERRAQVKFLTFRKQDFRLCFKLKLKLKFYQAANIQNMASQFSRVLLENTFSLHDDVSIVEIKSIFFKIMKDVFRTGFCV